MSLYQELTRELKSAKCPECLGLGKCNDAEAGDTHYNVWDCLKCKGTGLKYTVSLDIDYPE